MSFYYPKDCCQGFGQMDSSKVALPDFYIDWSDVNLWISMATIAFNPTYWNVLARWEYRNKGLSRIFGKYVGCWVLGASIFALGIFRDMRFSAALNTQPRWYTLQQNWILWLGYTCITIGTVFVFTSFYALGYYGTFLGDYFGILMDKKCTSFPFNIIDNPMYWGSFLNFFGAALVKASQSGILLSLVVAVCYKIAIKYEGPFTTKIYAEKDRGVDKSA
ncbi:phosphatidylethanolamine N-methyltransferase-like [Ruditapes philippinarum]|uniref:phosphatidylethanolamine N-methyltransferase-like n=1 Tax=Ruditapes philippinarum TaxID=129788 RepID=UPI00295AFA21|nr:phosphatidylethanolamine N-methyltransferase-like [Ruditapes philippinarum]